jgi:hypothetical protein
MIKLSLLPLMKKSAPHKGNGAPTSRLSFYANKLTELT